MFAMCFLTNALGFAFVGTTDPFALASSAKQQGREEGLN